MFETRESEHVKVTGLEGLNKVANTMMRTYREKIWLDEQGQSKDAFHDEQHLADVRSVSTAFLDVVKEQLNSEDGYFIEKVEILDDPLGIAMSFNDWNKQSAEEQKIKLSELPEVLTAFWDVHDLGNMYRVSEKSEDEIKIREHYVTSGAEDMAMKIAEVKIKEFFPEKHERYLPLIQHLIEMTKFLPSRDESIDQPFKLFVQVVDQGANTFVRNEMGAYRRELAMLDERATEGVRAGFVPDTEFNFLRRRLEVLLPNEEERKQVVEIIQEKVNLEFQIPEERVGLLNSIVTFQDWSSARQAFNHLLAQGEISKIEENKQFSEYGLSLFVNETIDLHSNQDQQ